MKKFFEKLKSIFTKKDIFIKIDDGKTILIGVNPFVSYILPEENLEESRQKILAKWKIINKFSILYMSLFLFIILFRYFHSYIVIKLL